MSNAAAVTQAMFGGGHSTALLLTTGGLLSHSDLFSHVVINLFDLFLLSCLKCFSFTWRGEAINAGEATLPGLVAVLRARPVLPGPPLGLLSILVWAQWTLTHGGVQLDPHQMQGTNRVGWKNPVQARAQSCMQRSNKWVNGSCVQHVPFFFPNLFAWRGFTRHSSPEGWAWIMAHQRRGLRSLMFIAWGLRCRKSLWECQWSRKEKTSLVPRPAYIFSIWNSCVLSQFSSRL